ncbi:MAG: AraC family transcriptional regulator [Acidimicrobiales bacterium]
MPGRLTRLQTLNTSRTTHRPQPRLKPRGLPASLEPHGIYAASNPAEAAIYGRDMWGSHRVVVTDGRPEDFNASLHGVLIRDVAFGYLDYSIGVTIDVQELVDSFLVLLPTAGSAVVVAEGQQIETSPVGAAVLSPRSRVRIDATHDCAHMIVRIERPAVERHLSRILGRVVRNPIHFDAGFDLTRPSATRWNMAVQLMQTEILDRNSLLHNSVGQGQLEEIIIGSLLYSHRSNYHDLLSGHLRPERRAVIDARDFIEQRLSEDFDVRMVANSAGVSVRTLQKLFSEDLQQSPTQYIRTRRLERARADLADAAPGSGVTVSAVASRWGFHHLGRFSVTYRDTFGESPSETLRS